jgi:hypothetical protein
MGREENHGEERRERRIKEGILEKKDDQITEN